MSDDLETVLSACEQLYAPVAVAGFPDRMLAALKPVFPSVIYSWELLTVREVRSISARTEDERGPCDLSHVMEAYQAYARQHPFAAAALSTAETAVVARSELLPDRRWERTDFFNHVLRPLGIKDQLTLTFHGEHAMAALVFHHESAVADRSKRALQLLAPHIRQALNASFRWDEAGRANASGLRHGRVVVGFNGRVEEMEPGAIALLQQGFPAERISGRVLPKSVRVWFDQAVHAMWSASEPAALRETHLVTAAGRLRLTLLTQFAARRHVILLAAERTAAGREQGLGALTAREREVLAWIAEGKRNAEIATILGSRPSTVKSQVETILRKLNAETRGAAAALWRAA
jgi:Response regulator containing a CheY-like receiver domain and an HTH DNA-binding domain